MRECAEEEDCLLAAGVSAPPADCLLVAGVSWPGAGAGAAMLPVLWRLGVRGLLLLCRSISLVTVQLPAPAAHIPAAPQLSRHTAAAGLGHRGRGHGAGGGQVTRVTIVTGHKSQAGSHSHWSQLRVTRLRLGPPGSGLAITGLAGLATPGTWALASAGGGQTSGGGDGVCMFVTLARDRRMRRTATWLVCTGTMAPSPHRPLGEKSLS